MEIYNKKKKGVGGEGAAHERDDTRSEVKLKDQLISHLLSVKALNIHLLLCQDLEPINKQPVFSQPASAQALYLLRLHSADFPVPAALVMALYLEINGLICSNVLIRWSDDEKKETAW